MAGQAHRQPEGPGAQGQRDRGKPVAGYHGPLLPRESWQGEHEQGERCAKENDPEHHKGESLARARESQFLLGSSYGFRPTE